jgi:ribosomal protein S18 acetylase RimI-like enzyme
MQVRRLTPQDAAEFQALRLFGLQDTPSAFASSYEEEVLFPESTIVGRLAVKPDRGPFGAFEGEILVGLVALGREGMNKLSHKAMVWGMYVRPEYRGKGVGRALLLEALNQARSVPGVTQVNLGVNANNKSAIRLYESVGFKSYGHESRALLINGEFHDELHMCLRLTNA